MPLERKGSGWVLVRQDNVLFILYELFTLTIASISFLKTRLIRTAINTADTNVILKQSVIKVILLSKLCLIYLPYQGSRSPKFGAEIRPHSQSQKVCFFPNSR